MSIPNADGEAARRRGAYAKGVRRRQEILDRAIEVFAERGAEGTSLRAIGDVIGVSHAALRHYFASREELLVEVYRSAEEATFARDRARADSSAAGLLIDAARQNRAVPGLVQLYSTLVAAAIEADHPIAREFITDRFAALRQTLADRIEKEQAAGTVRRDLPASEIASLIIAVSDGMQVQWLLDQSVSVERGLETLERLLVPSPADG